MSTLDNITLTVDGVTDIAVGKRNATFDTGTSLIIGDPAGIERFYEPLIAHHGAMRRPKGRYQSTYAALLIEHCTTLMS
jgi:hypothetical protein